jgi:hypothetical protein
MPLPDQHRTAIEVPRWSGHPPFAGWGLLSGRTWARMVAITLAVLSAIANFLFIPYYPFWSLLIIAVDVFVIWAIAAHGREVAV